MPTEEVEPVLASVCSGSPQSRLNAVLSEPAQMTAIGTFWTMSRKLGGMFTYRYQYSPLFFPSQHGNGTKKFLTQKISSLGHTRIYSFTGIWQNLMVCWVTLPTYRTVSRYFLPIFSLLAFSKNFRIWLWFCGDSRVERLIFLLRSFIDTG